MESAAEVGADCPVDARQPSAPGKKKRADKRTWAQKKLQRRPQLILRSELDGRTNAAKYFDRLVTAIENDLAGSDQLCAIEKVLIEAYAGAAVSLQHLNGKLALGQEIDISEHSSCVGALVRVASRLGIHRRQKDCTPTLVEYLAQKEREHAGD